MCKMHAWCILLSLLNILPVKVLISVCIAYRLQVAKVITNLLIYRRLVNKAGTFFNQFYHSSLLTSLPKDFTSVFTLHICTNALTY